MEVDESVLKFYNNPSKSVELKWEDSLDNIKFRLTFVSLSLVFIRMSKDNDTTGEKSLDEATGTMNNSARYYTKMMAGNKSATRFSFVMDPKTQIMIGSYMDEDQIEKMIDVDIGEVIFEEEQTKLSSKRRKEEQEKKRVDYSEDIITLSLTHEGKLVVLA